MAYYTCPKCKSTFSLREGMDKCPACLTPISDDIKSEFSDMESTPSKDGEASVAPKFEDLSFKPIDASEQMVNVDEGSYIIGAVLGLFLNWIGLIIALVMKKKKTIRGALIAFIVNIVVSVIVVIILVTVFGMGIFTTIDTL